MKKKNAINILSFIEEYDLQEKNKDKLCIK